MRQFKIPNTYVIIACVIALCAVATWFVPGGQYVPSDDGTLVYERVDAVPQTWQVFPAFYHGFVRQAGIIVFILVVGGAFWLLNATGAVASGISRFIAWVGRYDKVVLAAITVLFSAAGAVFGMSEETIPFVGIVVPLVVSMGYDALMGMLVVYVAANVGFSSAFLNPFTVGIAQGMAGLPLFSGMNYRIFCWAVLTVLMVAFVLFYAASDVFHIVLHGRGCHGAEREKGIDALAAAAKLVPELLALPERFPAERCVVSVGSLHAGTAGNIVSDRAELKGIVEGKSAEDVMRTLKKDARKGSDYARRRRGRARRKKY